VAATLYFLEQTGSQALSQITAGLKKALPDFTGFEFNTVGAQRIGFSMRFSDSRESMPAPRLSDGQLLVVGLMTLLYGPDRPPVLMIEEQETGLTSLVQREVYAAVRSLAFGEPPNRSQVLISSHSPFVLCEAWNGEDRDFVHQVKVEDGHAVVRQFKDAVAAQGINLLAKDEYGKRGHLGLRTAEELMSGYLA
jgi:predicted ATPase